MSADRSDATTGPMVPEQRGVRDAARAEVLARHGRLTKAGRPIFCRPSRAEAEGRALPRPGSDGKVIYSTREDAEAAARELEALGARPLRSYLCARSRGGHYHLTTDAPRTAHLPLHLRIPQQRRPLSA
ncbi:hypothetical protein [Pseudonocardia zijingensis]|jgi:hypothetical protein|uniref:Uncharacterized protein n=1 Tax=Pseudonocardia zijingensis TaxID=153376 RepID=A0ABN1PDS3_9PSEU